MRVGFGGSQVVVVSLALWAIVLVDGCGAKHPRVDEGRATIEVYQNAFDAL